MDHDFERVTPGDPMQCQWVNKNGQCINKMVHGSQFCPAHGGARVAANRAASDMAKYRLKQYQQRVSEFAGDDQIKSLREEIGILRMTLESLLNSLDSPNKLLLFVDKIQALIGQIQKTVESAYRMEEKMGTLIDRRSVIIIGDSIVKILAEFIVDPDQLNTIAGQICSSIEMAAGPIKGDA